MSAYFTLPSTSVFWYPLKSFLRVRKRPRRDLICATCVHLNQATPLFQLSRALRTCFALDQTSDDFPCARHARRSDQRQIRIAGGKRLVTTPTDHLASTNQTTCLPEDRPVAPGGSRQDGSVLETSALPCPGRRRCFGFHRELFRVFWKHKSRVHSRKPRLSLETITLIKEMAAHNRRLQGGAPSWRAAQAGYSEKSNGPSKSICGRFAHNEPVDRPGRRFCAIMRQRCGLVISCRSPTSSSVRFLLSSSST